MNLVVLAVGMGLAIVGGLLQAIVLQRRKLPTMRDRFADRPWIAANALAFAGLVVVVIAIFGD